MNYPFPVIRNISDVLPVIEGRPEFVVVDKGHYLSVRYVMSGDSTFPPVVIPDESGLCNGLIDRSATILRECRGLLFCKYTGVILRRPYHKFFNLGERGDEVADLTEPHTVLTKLDGSMVTPFIVDGTHLRWATKAGITDTSMQAEVFVATRPEYAVFAQMCIQNGLTPIFEWTSRKQQIVLDYPQDNLILTAARDMWSGVYLSFEALHILAQAAGIPVVSDICKSRTLTIDEIKAWTDAEGVVLRFDSGHMVKVKSDWYVMQHRAKDGIMRERDTVLLVMEDKIDDVLPMLPAIDQDRLRAFAGRVNADLVQFAEDVTKIVLDARLNGMEKEKFAAYADHARIKKHLVSAAFSIWEHRANNLRREAFEWGRWFVAKYSRSNESLKTKAQLILKNARWIEKDAEA